METVYEKLIADFKQDAYKEDTSRGFPLTTLKAQYIRERLNEVFGIDGWKMTGNYEKVDNGVLYFGALLIKVPKHDAENNPKTSLIQTVDLPHTVECVGFAKIKKDNLGDAYKSAQTDALSKCASFIGIGNDMFKGLIKCGSATKNNTEQKTPETCAYKFPSVFKKYANKTLDDVGEKNARSYAAWMTANSKGGPNTKLDQLINEINKKWPMENGADKTFTSTDIPY